MKQRALFLDRDGIINVPPPPSVRYILHPDAFHLMPGIAETIRRCNQQHIPVVVITNQKCVAIGKLSPRNLSRIHARMEELLRAENAYLDAVYACPHSEADACTCRKPLPGMLLTAAKALDLDLNASWMVGDQPRDIQAGKAAGCQTLHVHSEPVAFCDASLPDTRSLPEWLLKHFLQKEDCHSQIHTV